jgi:hypothetical protein
MTPETVILIATGVVCLRILVAPTRGRHGHLVRRTVRWVRRPQRSLSTRYHTYIRSPEWRICRQRALARAGYRCEHHGMFGRCRATYGLQVHHKHYRDFGHEWDGVRTHGQSLEVLCHEHHARADARRRRRGG